MTTKGGDGQALRSFTMKGFDTSEGYRIEPLDDRDEEDPEYTIDPMFSGTHADGGEHRELRHKEVEPVVKTPAERATINPEAEYEV